ncbi:MAG: pilus assembly protein N-terminal domain-containing protein [Pirellulaceae bacterium]|nr:pilus assembly protein N-terminal domain-containing protein [Pirellulaceae bacterium]MDG1809925.1 pilus assembly protein N-terminal domain-containing protein [Pirellulaceae bacterium]
MFRNFRRYPCYQACLILFFWISAQSLAWSQQSVNAAASASQVQGEQDTQILVPLPNTESPRGGFQDRQSQSVESESLPVSRIQSGFPEELILPPPDSVAVERANRLVTGTINPELPLNLVVGRPKVLQLAKAAKRIYVPGVGVIRTEIIDEESGREVAITGIAPGTTTLIFWFDDPNEPGGQSTVSYLVRVFDDPILARPITELADDLNTKFPNCFIELDQIEDRLIVKGQVPTITEMAQIIQVLVGSRGVRADLARPFDPVTVSTAYDLRGDIDPLRAEEEAAYRRRLIDPIALAQAGIINQLKVVGEQQVMLKVTVAEVNRTAARTIGMNFLVEDNAGFTVFQSTVGNLVRQGGGGGGANILASLDMGQVRLAIEALRRLNLSRTLAEPNLIAMNGQPAEFQAGGSFPVPIISSGGGGIGGQNLQGVSFIPFGVQLEFTPFIESNGVIRLTLNAEVSTRDESLGTSIGGGAGGTQVSGLNSRNFSTNVQLRSGQTIAVAGLMQTNYGASTDRVPFWGDLPIIGSTAGVNRSSSGEQELVILVTPHLVAPIDCEQRPLLPGSDVHEPTDIEFFVANRLESRRNKDFRATVQTDHARQKTAEKCRVQSYMMGTVGPSDRCNCLNGSQIGSCVSSPPTPVIESLNVNPTPTAQPQGGLQR